MQIIFLMPTIRPVTAGNVRYRPLSTHPSHFLLTFKQMNYAIAYLGGIFLLSTIYWYAQGKKFYHGPLVEAEVDIGIEGERSSEEAVEKTKKEEQGV